MTYSTAYLTGRKGGGSALGKAVVGRALTALAAPSTENFLRNFSAPGQLAACVGVILLSSHEVFSK